jgi:hypothetical protein
MLTDPHDHGKDAEDEAESSFIDMGWEETEGHN